MSDDNAGVERKRPLEDQSEGRMGAFTRLRASLSRGRGSGDDMCTRSGDGEEKPTTTLRNGKVVNAPSCSPSNSGVASTSSCDMSPLSCQLGPPLSSEPLSVQSSDSAQEFSKLQPQAYGSCAICWRDFGVETPLHSAALIKDSSLSAEEPHMFCVGCIAELCWRHHRAVRKALVEGGTPARGPTCPKCRSIFTHVLLHPSCELLADLPPAPPSLEAPPPPLPSSDLPSCSNRPPLAHTKEVSTRQLMASVGPMSNPGDSGFTFLFSRLDREDGGSNFNDPFGIMPILDPVGHALLNAQQDAT